jgi:site-specific recombinase XerD
VSDLCDWYLAEAEGGRILGRRNRPIKKSTLAMDKSRIETHIKPLLGTRLAHTLKVVDIEGMQSNIVAGKTAKPRGGGRGGAITGGPGVASRAVATLQSILGHAARLDKIEGHPSRGARKLASKKKTRRLSEVEIKKLGAAMRYAARNGEHPVGLAIVRFLLLTGFRISEGQGLQRPWLHADAGYVSFPDTKGDAQIRAIGQAAAELAVSQPVRKDCPYIFPADVGDGHFTAAKACLARLCASVGIVGVTPHTLRHTFGSVAGDLGFSELTIRALLGHAAQSVTQGYVHVDEALKLAVTRTCQKIAYLLDEEEYALPERRERRVA